MTTYAYTALEPSGARKTGFIEAKDKDAAIAAVAAQGRFVVEIGEKKAQSSALTLSSNKKITKSDTALFTRRLADLASAGLPLDRVLQVVGEQAESLGIKEIAAAALEDVRGGLPVSSALAKFPKYFPPLFTETLKAGEASGQFGEVATRLAEVQEKEVTRRSQIVSALTYPSVLTGVAIMTVIFVMTFVVPRLMGVFEDLGDALPITTKMLLGASSFISNNYLMIIGGSIGLYILYKAWSATEAGALARDRFVLKAPVMGKVITKAVISRYARVLSTLIYGGVPILDALHLAGLAAGNRVFQITSDRVAEDVREGKSIHQAMEDAATFPPVLTHMVAIGEETGDLPKMLGRVCDSLDFEVDNGMRRLISLVEPVIVLGLGGFVGFVVISVILPIFQAQDLVK